MATWDPCDEEETACLVRETISNKTHWRQHGSSNKIAMKRAGPNRDPIASDSSDDDDMGIKLLKLRFLLSLKQRPKRSPRPWARTTEESPQKQPRTCARTAEADAKVAPLVSTSTETDAKTDPLISTSTEADAKAAPLVSTSTETDAKTDPLISTSTEAVFKDESDVAAEIDAEADAEADARAARMEEFLRLVQAIRDNGHQDITHAQVLSKYWLLTWHGLPTM